MYYEIRRQRIIFLRVAQVKKAKDFFTDELHTRAGSTRSQEAVESARAGLSQKRKEKRKTKEGGLSPQEGDVRKKRRRRPRKARRWLHEGKVPCALNQEFLFLVHEYSGSERPVSFEVLAPTRLSLRGSLVQRKFRKRTTLCSKSSTLIALLYAG
jgi:hypothetical protein